MVDCRAIQRSSIALGSILAHIENELRRGWCNGLCQSASNLRCTRKTCHRDSSRLKKPSPCCVLTHSHSPGLTDLDCDRPKICKSSFVQRPPACFDEILLSYKSHYVWRSGIRSSRG